MDANGVHNSINTMAKMWIVPHKFLLRYPLSIGAIIYGVIMIVVMLAGIIASIVEMLNFKSCFHFSHSLKRSAYGFNTMCIIYCVMMIIINAWFIWAVKKSKSSVVLVWVVATTVWLVLTTFLIVVMLFLYIDDTNLASWILSVVFAIIGFVMVVYGILVGFGLWVELKTAGMTASSS